MTTDDLWKELDKANSAIKKLNDRQELILSELQTQTDLLEKIQSALAKKS